MRHRKTSFALMFALTFGAAVNAAAATRVVVVPVVVGGGAEPDQKLILALAQGLRTNQQWQVLEHAETFAALGAPAPPALSEDELGRIEAKVNDAAGQTSRDPGASIAGLESVRARLAQAAPNGPLGLRGDALSYRAAGLLVAAWQAAGDAAKARLLAAEVGLLFPGRRPVATDNISAAAADLLAAPRENAGTKLTLKTRPEGCEVVVNGVTLGKTSVDVAVMAGATYDVQARCAGAAQGSIKATPGTSSSLRRITIAANETTRQEILDAEFERNFAGEGLRRLRYASSNERRQIEETYARRVAERLGADVVVFAALGELSGSDWLNAKLYLKSGFLNRQGLVRLESDRASGLGKYLATGKDVVGVLKPQEADALVAASKASPGEHLPPPWYTDVPGWCMTGVGLTALGFGLWMSGRATAKTDEADAVRGDPNRQQALYRSASNMDFWAGIGTVGGGIMAVLGVVLLVVPEPPSSSGDMFTLRPVLGPGLAGLVGTF